MKTNPLKRIPLTKEEYEAYMNQLLSIRNEIKSAADKIKANEEQEKKIWNMQMEIDKLNSIVMNLMEDNKQLNRKLYTNTANVQTENRKITENIRSLQTRIDYLRNQISQK